MKPFQKLGIGFIIIGILLTGLLMWSVKEDFKDDSQTLKKMNKDSTVIKTDTIK